MEKFIRKTPQQQVWELLRTEDQRAIVASNLRHIKHRTQYDLCIALVAYLRWGIIRPFDDTWVNRNYQALVPEERPPVIRMINFSLSVYSG